MADPFAIAPSAEWQIDSKLEELADKMLRNVASEDEIREYKQLASLRSRKMTPDDRAHMARVRELLRG